MTGTCTAIQPGLRRRRVLGRAAALIAACGPLSARSVWANDGALSFDTASIADALREMNAISVDASQLLLVSPDVAEDGALVPISVESRLPGTQEIYLVVDVNPDPVAARFSVPIGTDPFVATRIKVAGDGTVYAIVKDQEGRIHVSSRAMKVIVGGCS